jgi:TorA-specific chaperone
VSAAQGLSGVETRHAEACHDSQSAFVADWLGGLFMAPLPAEALADYLCPDGAALLESIGLAVHSEAATAQMHAALVTASRGAGSSLDQGMSRSYTRLFEGVSAAMAVSLYESAYTGNGRLFQQPVSDMAAVLRHLDLSIDASCCEPPDHLAIELAALTTALQRDDGDSIAALQARLATWVPRFAAGCRQADPDGFYAGAATVLEAFLADPLKEESHVQAN